MMVVSTLWLVVVCLVWAGMVLGISFLEAPVKFRAPSLTRAVGLDVGRRVFGVLGKVEVGWVLLTALLALLSNGGAVWFWSALGLVWVVVLVQRVWLWPALKEHAGRVISGEDPPHTYHHAAYIGSEAVKVAGLVGLSVALLYGGAGNG